jgi:hypothetical protein
VAVGPGGHCYKRPVAGHATCLVAVAAEVGGTLQAAVAVLNAAAGSSWRALQMRAQRLAAAVEATAHHCCWVAAAAVVAVGATALMAGVKSILNRRVVVLDLSMRP